MMKINWTLGVHFSKFPGREDHKGLNGLLESQKKGGEI
jgi:hypothetical protein